LEGELDLCGIELLIGFVPRIKPSKKHFTNDFNMQGNHGD